MAKFKVGDRVTAHGNIAGISGAGTICRIDAGHPVSEYCVNFDSRPGAHIWAYNNSVKPLDQIPKILITTDGKTTLARLYEGEKVTKSAEAKCAPSDTPDFAVGATLAFDRLMGREAEKKPDSKHTYKAGDKVKIIGSGHPITHFAPIGSVQKVMRVHKWGVDVEYHDQTVSFADIEPYAETQKDAFDWDAFKAGKIAVECKTEESKNSFLRDCEKQLPDLRWHSGDKPTSRDYPAPIVFQCKNGTMGKGAYGGVQPIDYAISEPAAKDTPAPTFTVTRAQIAALGACSSGLAWFDKRHPDGEADFGKLVKEAEQEGRSGDAAWLRNREAKLKEAPKGWSGKVVCVDDGGCTSSWIVGCIFVVDNETIRDKDGDMMAVEITSIDDLHKRTAATFIEYKGEARHE